MVVRVDGPYGHATPVSTYDDLLFVAGGIGVTPCHANVRALYLSAKAAAVSEGGGIAPPSTYSALDGKPSRVKMVWVVRDRAQAALFAETLRMVAADDLDGRFSVALHLTGAAAVTSPTGAAEKTQPLPKLLGLLGGQSGGDGVVEPGGRLTFISGRPDIVAELRAMGHPPLLEGEAPTAPSGEGRRSALVFVCGPASLSAACDAAALGAGVDFHAETFEL